MPAYRELFDEMAPWRKAVTVGLTALAIVVLVLIVTGAIGGLGVALALAIVVVSYLVGPRSPFL